MLHPLLAGRFSPVAFDPSAHVDSSVVALLLEAARRAPSAGNSQPWRFIVGLRGDEVHQRIVKHLARSSGRWAPQASLVVVNLTQTHVEDSTDLIHSEFSLYDLGQAVAHMAIQARALGLEAHQFRAFDQEAVAHEFAVPDHYQVASMTAFGVPAHGPDVTGSGTTRERLAVDELLWESPCPDARGGSLSAQCPAPAGRENV